MNYTITIAQVLEYCFVYIQSIRMLGTIARWSNRLVQKVFLCYQLGFEPIESHTQLDDLETDLTLDLSGTSSFGSYKIYTGRVQLALNISGNIYFRDELELVCNSSRFLGHDPDPLWDKTRTIDQWLVWQQSGLDSNLKFFELDLQQSL